MAGCWLPLAVLGQKSSGAHGGVAALHRALLAFKYCCSMPLVGQGTSPLWLLFLESFVSLEARYLNKKQSEAQRMRWPGSTTTVLGPANTVFISKIRDRKGETLLSREQPKRGSWIVLAQQGKVHYKSKAKALQMTTPLQQLFSTAPLASVGSSNLGQVREQGTGSHLKLLFFSPVIHYISFQMLIDGIKSKTSILKIDERKKKKIHFCQWC